MLKIDSHLKEMHALIEELDSARENYKIVLKEIEALDGKYQRGELDYRKYTEHKKRILRNKTLEDVNTYFSLFLGSVRERLYELNSKIASTIEKDESYNMLVIGKRQKKESSASLPDLDALEIAELEVPVERIEVKKIEAEKPKPALPEPWMEAPSPEQLEALKVPMPVKLGFFKRLAYAFQAKEKPWLDSYEQGNVAFGGIFSVAFLKYLFEGKEKEGSFGSTSILPSILSYEDQERIDRDLNINKSDILDPYMLEKQIKELKSLISKKKPDVYKASTLGYLSNITVRRISIYFIEKFPDFFKSLYKAIRFSNIKVLANTYINIIFFLTFVSGLASIPIFTIFFSMQGDSAAMTFLKTGLASFIVANLTFWGGVYYPYMKAKSRKRSINTNLPFAIDHMSSVIASGVSPATMFKLISTSREYGEISVEIEKVSNYIDFFGYDILTSLKAVALITPSEDFKEFIDGFVSTIETGGDLKEFLSQKSGEALLNYRLERQKYVESLSTYSDIYTGVLIAAPLFFVTALSLVSVLGGTIGGMSVNTIITIGTYLIIPGLNLLFLIFLELNQPEI